MKAWIAVFAFCSSCLFASEPAKPAVTTRGWFSDSRCAPSTLKSGRVGPNNRDCVQKCLSEGAKMVFIDERAKALFEVDNPDAAKGQESHHVEITATVGAEATILHVTSVKVLEPYRASCSLPEQGK